MSNSPLKLTIILGTSLSDREATDEKISAGHFVRGVVESNTEQPESVSAFLKRFLTIEQPTWLYHIVQHVQHEQRENPFDNAMVAFGGGEAVGIKVRDSTATSTSTSQGFGLAVNLYQIENSKGDKPILLHSKGKCYMIC